MENKFTSQLKDLKLYKENEQYYLDATYINESLSEVCEINVPKIRLPFSTFSDDEITICQRPDWISHDYAYIKSGSQTFPLEKVYKTKHIDKDKCPLDGVYFTTKCIKEKTQEMTIEEIEKKLGHKVRIVNKEK